MIHEATLKIGGATKAPDYCFRIGGTQKFYLEAKKPAVNIKEDVSPAFQLRRYAWSAKLPLSILTDFEEFAVYDCRIKPDKADKPSVGRLLCITYDQYPERWEEIVNIFSKDAILKGSFDKFTESAKGKRGTVEVDAAFLNEIEAWREMLARNIALRNPGLSQRELNFAVQNTIDRIIFLRICEDRGIELYGQLKNTQQGSPVYGELCRLFRRADDRYNSGLFHFKREKGRDEPPDELTLNLTIDDKPLKEIFRSLYYPDSPYEFSVLPADILGQVYEQFLGKVIRLTAGHRAVVEDKPEVKKAGGVYYTPTYVVDYIVKNTVGKLLEGKTLRQAATLKILDPDCGSRSFLIGVYQYLLEWHLNWYVQWHLNWYVQNGPQKHTREVHQGPTGDWRLTTAERKRILLNNIYGVDIDPQAVEVTKLSLLLKVLDGETEQTIAAQLKLFQERALPDLGDNIKCGNSLIGPDFYDTLQVSFLDEEEQYHINVFDWQTGFPEVFQRRDRGFDTVIGNPPYLYSAGQDYLQYFNSHYRLSQYQTDFYVYFIERALILTRSGGKVSFIVSDSWLNSDYFSKLREHLLTKHKVDVVTVFDCPVFRSVTLENSIFVVTVLEKPATIVVDRFSHPSSCSITNQINPEEALRRGLLDPRQSIAHEPVIARIEKNSLFLDRYVKLNRGIHPYRTDGYGKSKFEPGPQTKKDKETCSYHADRPLDDTYLPELKGKDIGRFTYAPSGKFLSYGPWLAEPRQPEFFFKPKIALRKILGPRLYGTFIELKSLLHWINLSMFLSPRPGIYQS